MADATTTKGADNLEAIEISIPKHVTSQVLGCAKIGLGLSPWGVPVAFLAASDRRRYAPQQCEANVGRLFGGFATRAIAHPEARLAAAVVSRGSSGSASLASGCSIQANRRDAPSRPKITAGPFGSLAAKKA